MFTHRSVLLVLLAVCGLLLLSAAPALADDGKVEGIVTLDGKPLATGKITFHLDNGQFVGSKIKDGNYTVDRVPGGTWKVAIEGAGVPVRYSSEDTTPLRLAVLKEGSKADIALKR